MRFSRVRKCFESVSIGFEGWLEMFSNAFQSDSNAFRTCFDRIRTRFDRVRTLEQISCLHLQAPNASVRQQPCEKLWKRRKNYVLKTIKRKKSMSDSDSDWEQPVYVSKELQEQISANLDKVFPNESSVKGEEKAREDSSAKGPEVDALASDEEFASVRKLLQLQRTHSERILNAF